jgi:DNA polymerase-3 subunit epsilon
MGCLGKIAAFFAMLLGVLIGLPSGIAAIKCYLEGSTGAAIVGLIFTFIGFLLFRRGHREYHAGEPSKSAGSRKQSIAWARKILNDPDRYVILDTETTGLDDHAEIVEIAVINLNGDTLLNSRVRPLRRKTMPAEAENVHGISIEDLIDAPSWPELCPSLEVCLAGKIIVSYNADFDSRLIQQTSTRNRGTVSMGEWQCAMLKYAAFFGEWDDYHKSFKWQKLVSGDHTALGDCLATRLLIRGMAAHK